MNSIHLHQSYASLSKHSIQLLSAISFSSLTKSHWYAFQSSIPLITHQTAATMVCPFPHRNSTPQMLRVQKKRRPDDWDKKKSKLSGRFLPMDPRDEAIINLLESDNSLPEVESEYGPEGPPAEAYGESSLGRPKKWSKRSEAARKRWADPSYRAKMLEKRAAKRRMNEEANGGPKQKVEIGRMDSITLCDDDRAKAINDYARSNKLRSEKISAFHRNRKLWMETRLSAGQPKLSDEEYIQMKKAQQERRRNVALRRVRNSRSKKAEADPTPDEADSETVS